MSMMQSLFDRLPENRFKNAFRFWVAQSPFSPHFLRRVSPLVGYEYLRPLRTGDIVVDAGAFTGDFTVYASRKVGPTGRVIALEPDPYNLGRLRQNLRGELDNVTIVERGLWSSDGELLLQVGTQGFASGVTDFARTSSSGREVCIPVARLDGILEQLGISEIDVLKMDIEGSEIEALKGCESILRTSAVHICIASYHQLEGANTSRRIENQLMTWGYQAVSAFPCHLTTYGWRA